MPKSKKYYVVWKGRKTGVFSSWEDCKKQVDQYQGAQYRGFSSLQEAKQASQEKYKNYLRKKSSRYSKNNLVEQPNYNSICVDAASSGNPGKMEYRGVCTKTKKQLFIQGPYQEASNNMGEFLALVHGLAYLKQHNQNSLLYSDSQIAIGWVKKKVCNTKVKRTTTNKVAFDLIDRALHWLKSNTYETTILKWETKQWGEIPADFGRKK